MQVLLMLVLKVLFMKNLCYMIHLFTHCITIVLIAAFITCAYNSIDQYYDGMSLQKLSFYRLPTRGRVGTKLGDADTSPTYR